jgi:hydroxymethylpyrimidine/phosphomethylpyrimidine kinase
MDALVVDPVMVSKAGAPLLEPDAEATLRDTLLPRALLVCPNLPEAARLTGVEADDLAGMKDAARALVDLGSRWALVKGGHLEGDPVDLLFDGEEFLEVRRVRIETRNTHGTGCTYSAAIATELGGGRSVPDAVEAARSALQAGLEHALELGEGYGPLDHAAIFGRSE